MALALGRTVSIHELPRRNLLGNPIFGIPSSRKLATRRAATTQKQALSVWYSGSSEGAGEVLVPSDYLLSGRPCSCSLPSACHFAPYIPLRLPIGAVLRAA